MSTEAFFTISPGKIVKIGLQKSVFYNSAAGQDWAAGPPTWIVPHRACPAFAQGAPEARVAGSKASCEKQSSTPPNGDTMSVRRSNQKRASA